MKSHRVQTRRTPDGILVTLTNPWFSDAFTTRTAALERLDVPGVPRIEAVDERPPGRLESLPGEAIKVEDANQARKVLLQCVDVLDGMHKAGVVHGALSWENVVRVEDQLTLARPAALLVRGMEGCPLVHAGGLPGPEMDIWSLGQIAEDLGAHLKDDDLTQLGEWLKADRPSLQHIREDMQTTQAKRTPWPGIFAGAVAAAAAILVMLLI